MLANVDGDVEVGPRVALSRAGPERPAQPRVVLQKVQHRRAGEPRAEGELGQPGREHGAKRQRNGDAPGATGHVASERKR